MKHSFFALSLFLLSFLGITSLALTAAPVSEQTVSRENYRECLQSVASKDNSSEFYGANIMAEGIIQTPANDENLCYTIADGIDPEAPIYGLTRQQQEFYCRWIQDQKQNEGTCCYLKNDDANETLSDNQETVIIIAPHDSSSEKDISPLMMFEEPGEKKKEKDAPLNKSRTSESTDLSSLQQRSIQPARIKESDTASTTSDLTYSDDANTEVASYRPSQNQLETKITAAREKAFQATKELLSLRTQQQQIETLWDSYRNLQKTLASAYTLRSCLRKSSTAQLQAYQQIVHGICQEAELAYNNAQQKLKTFQQLPGSTPAAAAFIEQAYVNFSEAQRELYELKQQHEQELSTDSDSIGSTLVETYEDIKKQSEIIALSFSKTSKPTTEEQEALRLEQFLKDHQWYAVGKKGKKIALPETFFPDESEARDVNAELLLKKAGVPQKTSPLASPSATAPALLEKANGVGSTDILINHQSSEEQSHQDHSELLPAEDLDHNDGDTKTTAATPAPSKKKTQKKKKAASEVVPISQPLGKSDADWEAEVTKKFPFRSFDLETYNRDQFQENATHSAKSLIEDPNYSSFFEGMGQADREKIRNLISYDYCINGTERGILLGLKTFLKMKVNAEYYSSYIQQKIQLAKIALEEQERLSSLATEAENKLLAELAGEKKSKQQAKQNSATGKSKSKKK